MDIEHAIKEIIKAHERSEITRDSLIKLSKRIDNNRSLDMDSERLQRLFETDQAFRNGMVYALNVAGVLSEDDRRRIDEETFTPSRFFDEDFRMT